MPRILMFIGELDGSNRSQFSNASCGSDSIVLMQAGGLYAIPNI